MVYNIKRLGVTIASVRPNGSISTKMMSEELVNMSFTLSAFIKFQIGDSVQVYGNTYYLGSEPEVDKKNSREFVFNLQFTGIKYLLRDVQLFSPDSQNKFTIPGATIMGTLDECLTLIVANINRIFTGWTKGIVDVTETKQITFSEGENCLSAIAKLADEFELEYWIDGDKTIHFTERKTVSGLSLEYGQAKGLKGISRTPFNDSNIVTRLYALGGSQNLPKDYKDGQKSLRMAVPYLAKNTSLYGVIEHTEVFDEVFPKYTGTVTAVNANDPLIFTDANFPFDLQEMESNGTDTKYLIKDLPVKIKFQTGQLAGYELEIHEYGWDNATKTFTLLLNKDEKDLEIPSDLIKPAIGDEYIIYDVRMPQVFVDSAETLLQDKAQQYLDENSRQRFQYNVIGDPIYFKAQNINLILGNTVHFIDADFDLDDHLRVVAITKDLNNPFDVQFEISENATLTAIVKNYLEQQNQQQAILDVQTYNAVLARRSYVFAKQFHDKVIDPEGYFDPEIIKPLSIETKMLSLGSRLQQFSLPGVNFFIENNNGSLRNTAGKIIHLTIDPDEPREWNIAQNVVNGISPNFNYIYIKCDRAGTNASVVVSEDVIKVEQIPDFYHFEMGMLSEIIDDYRKIKATHGFAQLNPAELSIGKISDPDGNNSIELLQDKIKINAEVTFTNDSPAFEQIQNSLVGGNKNLIKNSGFNYLNETEHWIFWYATFNFNQPSYDGNKVLSLLADGSQVYGDVWQNITNLKGQQPYEFVFDFKGVGSFFCVEYDVNNNYTAIYQDHYTQLASSEWEHKIIKFISQPETVKFILIFRNESTVSELSISRLALFNSHIIQDWIPAIEDLETQIANVETLTETINQTLDEYSSDNILSPIEKTTLLQIFDGIVSEYPIVIAQAGQYAVSTANLTTKYNALVSYVDNENVFDNLSVSTPINGVDLRNYFKEYNSAKVAIVKVITDLISQQMDAQLANIQDLENKTDFLAETAVQGNAVATGSLLVGDADGGNGGITGLTDPTLGLDSVALWFGKPFADRNTAPIRITRSGKIALESKIQGSLTQGLYLENGEIVWRDENGIVRRRIGILTGKPLDKTYNGAGTLLYEINENGFVSYATADEWIATTFFNFNNSNNNLSQQQLRDLADGSIIHEVIEILPGEKYRHTLKLNSNYNCFKYVPGNTNSNNLQYEGYKTNNTNNQANIPNGWYTTSLGIFVNNQNSTSATTQYSVDILMWYISGGKVSIIAPITVTT